MYGSALGRGPRPLPLALLVAASALTGSPAPALAGKECNRVSDYPTVSSPTFTLRRMGSTPQMVRCPPAAPYLWGWSWDKSSKAVVVTVIGDTGSARNPALFTAINWSLQHPSTVTFYIACTRNAGGIPS